ncbi:MAG TPA: SDR family NAD(P)-dependent oxidoreductase, partial [Candidatus Deferrimicrobiaceae bacterium]|nr:SDR family NAD(P)-dependent oxidoreductase [Candidatus Deferrimicrobiaceae bacterium]
MLMRYPDMVGKVALVTVHRLKGGDMAMFETTVRALARSGANMVLAGGNPEDLERIALQVNSAGGEGMATVFPVDLAKPSAVQELFDSLPRIDLLLHFTGSVDWKRPLTTLPYDEWTATVDQFGYVPRLLCWQAERRMDRDAVDGTIVIVGPDLSGIPSIRERNLVQVFQAMLRPAVATESMERALMRKAQADGTSPSHVSSINIGLILPGRTDGRNKQGDPVRTAASALWFLEEGKNVSGVALLPDEKNSLARLPEEPKAMPGSMAGKVTVVTGGIRNLGKEISLRFASEKATVVIASRRPNPAALSGEEAEKAKEEFRAGDAVLAKMRQMGARSIWINADISLPQKVRAVIEETRNRFGAIDAYVNNAGIGGNFSLIGDVLRDHRQSWDAVMRCNLLSPWIAISLLREIMRKQADGGTIVNVSTHYADHPYLFRTIYTVSKIVLKALTLSLSNPLREENIRIVDVAPSLIAGPRMDWVMKNYAVKFAEQFERIPGMTAAEARSLQEFFIQSFDRSLPPDRRKKAASSFLSAAGSSRLSKSARAEMDSWYERAKDWFRSTVPDVPPTNEQVADAVLFGTKNARFLDDTFLGVSSLPAFTTFPPGYSDRKKPPEGASYLLLSVGEWGEARSAIDDLGIALSRQKATVTSIVESRQEPGQVKITRVGKESRRTENRNSPETFSRALDLSDPRLLEPWLDHSLLGGPPTSGAVLFAGTSTPGKPVLKFTLEDMERFFDHLGRVLSVFAESARAVREDGNLVVVVPPGSSEEGQLVRAAVRQMVRTLQAEQHFLFLAKRVRVSLLTAWAPGREREFSLRVRDLLSGTAPPEWEAIPVGRLLP